MSPELTVMLEALDFGKENVKVDRIRRKVDGHIGWWWTITVLEEETYALLDDAGCWGGLVEQRADNYRAVLVNAYRKLKGTP